MLAPHHSTTEPVRPHTDIADANTQAFATLHGFGEPFRLYIGTMNIARLLRTFAAAVAWKAKNHVGIPTRHY